MTVSPICFAKKKAPEKGKRGNTQESASGGELLPGSVYDLSRNEIVGRVPVLREPENSMRHPSAETKDPGIPKDESLPGEKSWATVSFLQRDIPSPSRFENCLISESEVIGSPFPDVSAGPVDTKSRSRSSEKPAALLSDSLATTIAKIAAHPILPLHGEKVADENRSSSATTIPRALDESISARNGRGKSEEPKFPPL